MNTLDRAELEMLIEHPTTHEQRLFSEYIHEVVVAKDAALDHVEYLECQLRDSKDDVKRLKEVLEQEGF